MDTTERQVINELFDKVGQVESTSAPRDAEAEALIRERLSRQPAAPYYMAQTIVMQEQALAATQARLDEVERDLAQRPASGGFLGGLFGGGSARSGSVPASPRRSSRGGPDPRLSGYADPRRSHGGGGFLAGAAQTAVGVAGGVLLGNALAGLFTGDEAAAEPLADDTAAESVEDPADSGLDDLDTGFFDEEF